tara:strand:+ start:1397 stop:2134 length:738 start_codon:yes stop_codon:yes gene_type:complete
MQGIKKDMQQDMRIAKLEAAGGGGSALDVQDDGVSKQNPTSILNFTGDGVDVTANEGEEAQIHIPGGGGATGEAFSPLNVGAAGNATVVLDGFGNMMYLTVAEYNGTIDKVTVWGANSGENDGDVVFACYRWVGVDNPGNVLMGLAETDPLDLCDHGPNVLSFVAAEGQNMEVVAGENLVVGMYLKSGTWETVGLAGIGFESWIYGIESAVGGDFPETVPQIEEEGWASSANRFACTLWQDTPGE